MGDASRRRNHFVGLRWGQTLEPKVLLAGEMDQSTTALGKTLGNGFSVNGGQLQFNDAAYEILGISYSAENLGYPLALGKYRTPELIAQEANADFQLIAATGANTVRLYDPFLEAPGAFEVISRVAQQNGLKLLVGFPRNWPTEIARFVRQHQDNKTIIGYVVGNEVNMNRFQGTVSEEVATSIELSNLIRREDGENHLIVSSWGEIPPAAIADRFDAEGSFDIHSTNYYRDPTHRSFDQGLQQFAQATTKPVLVLEYGYDSYIQQQAREDRDSQAEANRAAHQRLAALMDQGILAGVSIFGFRDQIYRSDGASGVATFEQKTGSYTPGFGMSLNYAASNQIAAVDGFQNDEYLGLTDADGQEKPAYFETQRFFQSR